HARGHRMLPSEINFRANIYGFKSLGIERIVSISAVGSLREELHPLDVVVPDQFIDMTRHRPSTFFGAGLVAHVSLADPVCPDLGALLVETAAACGARVHRRAASLKHAILTERARIPRETRERLRLLVGKYLE